METSLNSMSINEAVEYTLKIGFEKFRYLIWSSNAAEQLRMEPDDFLQEFSTYLLEQKAKPIYMFKGNNGASFKSYIAVIFRNWLNRFLSGKGIKLHSQSDEIIEKIKSSDLDTPEAYIKAEEEARVLDALIDCKKQLSERSYKLIDLVNSCRKKISDIAKEMKSKQSDIYNEYYKILKSLKNCLSKKGIDKGMVTGL